MSPSVYYFFLFLLGVAVGSFLNVVVSRYDVKEEKWLRKLGGRSKCPKCKTTLEARDLIPIISFLVLKRRCRHCKAKISWLYPVIELVTGFVWVGVPAFLNEFFSISSRAFFLLQAPVWHYWMVGIWIVVFCVWIVMTVIDIKQFIIPDQLNIMLGAGGIVLAYIKNLNEGASVLVYNSSFLKQYSMILSPVSDAWVNHLLGACAAGLFFSILFLVSKGRGMGLGDVKLAFVGGLLLGWPDIALSVVLSFMVGGLWSVALMLSKRKNFGDKIPFAPFIVLGMVLVFFLGEKIISSYFSLFQV